MSIKGKITSWNDEKGFGFITPNDGGDRIFFHIKAFNSRNRPLINQSVTYTSSVDKAGRRCAVKVTKVGDRVSNNRHTSTISFAFTMSIAFFCLLITSVITNMLPLEILPYYLTISLITFFWYWKDKVAARSGNWRTPESTLHFLSLIGGWPGGMIAQETLRHKSKKESFRAVFWVTTLINIGIFMWFHTTEGFELLNQIIR